MAQAAAAGLDVAVWTVNDPALAARMLDLGVAGIVTDYPDRMRRAVAGARAASCPTRRPSRPAQAGRRLTGTAHSQPLRRKPRYSSTQAVTITAEHGRIAPDLRWSRA